MSALQGNPFLTWRDAQLCLEDQPLAALAERFGTPLYVYSRGAMRTAAAGYQRALAGQRHRLAYAVKANSNLAVLQTFVQQGLGFDVVSGGELQRVLAAGGKAADCVFSGVGKADAEVLQALRAGIRCINVESEAELHQVSRIASASGLAAPIALRVNPDIDAGTHPYISTGLKSNKFGVPHADALRLYRLATTLPGLAVQGIACHIGSQITRLAPYLDALDRVLDLVDALAAEGIRLSHLDMGGGLGIAYSATDDPPSPQALVGGLRERLDARGHHGLTLELEPGRSLVGPAGVLLARVIHTKPGAEKNFCIVDAAMNDLARPAMYEAWMDVSPCVKTATPPARWDVVGPVCESGDWLARDRDLAVQPGDVLAVLTAGAYGMSMASNYNSRPRPAEVLVDGTSVHLVRERETLPALYALEHLLPT
ncbi:MAG: diaminopimelate decarboxylase [Proteobacteria bacterium]|nr:diaminopimelate decarboxylase [Pseudomonadota bacterium]